MSITAECGFSATLFLNGGGCPIAPPNTMSWLWWNVRGLGKQLTIHELASIMRAQDPAVLFLAETWADDDRLMKICDDLHFDEKWLFRE